MENIIKNRELMRQFKTVQMMMIAAGTAKGLGDAETLAYSRKLDRLMNEIQFQSK